MNRWYISLTALLLPAFLSLSCAGSFSNPLTIPASTPSSTASALDRTENPSGVTLWGFWDCSIDTATREVSAIPNRSVMFAANVVQFLNNNPMNLSFKINDVDAGGWYTDIDIDVTIRHPFPGMPQYDGYDVRGIFICDGSGTLASDPSIRFPVHDEGDPFGNQTMPLGLTGSADGYTRWFNPTEFTSPGMFGYVPGIFAKPGYVATATICPYRYFADGLGAIDDVWDFLTTSDNNGVFSSGTMNTRQYNLRWPSMMAGLPFSYAVAANWQGPDIHPSNAPEAVGCDVDIAPSLYYVDDTNNGGYIIADISIFDWSTEYSSGPIEDYLLTLESTVLSMPVQLNVTEMTPVGGGEHFSTFHVDIIADNIQSADSNELWIIAGYENFDYKNNLGVPNLCADDPLTAYFRFPLEVSDQPVSEISCNIAVDPASPPMPYVGMPAAFTFDASGSYDVGGADLTFQWDFDDNGVFGDSFDSGTDEMPVRIFTDTNQSQVCVRVSNGTVTEDCCVPVDITITVQDKNIPLRDGFDAMDIAVDHADGDLLVLYSDGIVYRYTETGDYQDGTEFFMTFEPGIQYIDIAPNSFIVVGGEWVDLADKMKFYNPDGTLLSNAYIGNECYAHDVIAFTGNTYTNMLGISSFTCPMGSYFRWRWYEPPDYTVYFYANLMGGCGLDTIGRDSALACEAGNISMNYVYVLEGVGGGCYEYRVQRVWRPGGTDISNDPTVTWGGSQSDGMDGFWNPLDITRDIDNDFYILDSLSTNVPTVKKYTETGTPIGFFGDSSSISGNPLRIEGSDYEGADGNLIFVIHDGGAGNPDMLSIFYPLEIPD